jgi:hypothetical protein
MNRKQFPLHTRSAWLVLAAMLLLAGCSSSGGEELKDLSDGKLAPESATLKWEREIQATTIPRHIIRRYTAPDPAAAVARYYNDALTGRGWEAAPGADADYAEWTHEGMVISLVFEPDASAGSEWSLALFAAP